MSDYKYNYLLRGHLKSAQQTKEALPLRAIGQGAMALGRGALNFGKGLFGANSLASAGMAGKAMNVAGKVTSVAAPIAGSLGVGAVAHQGGPTLNVAGMQMGGGGAGSQAGAHYAEELVKAAGLAVLSRGEKQANGPLWRNALEVGSYGAMIGSKFVDPHSPIHKALDYGGLAGLGLATAHEMATDPGARKPGLKDLLGLGLFASGIHDRSKAGH